MGAQMAKGGVAAEGKAVAEPANAKANGQVSDGVPRSAGACAGAGRQRPHGTQRPLSAWLSRRRAPLPRPLARATCRRLCALSFETAMLFKEMREKKISLFRQCFF